MGKVQNSWVCVLGWFIDYILKFSESEENKKVREEFREYWQKRTVPPKLGCGFPCPPATSVEVDFSRTQIRPKSCTPDLCHMVRECMCTDAVVYKATKGPQFVLQTMICFSVRSINWPELISKRQLCTE